MRVSSLNDCTRQPRAIGERRGIYRDYHGDYYDDRKRRPRIWNDLKSYRAAQPPYLRAPVTSRGQV